MEILNSEPPNDLPDSKGVRLDFLAKLNNSVEVDIEVQVRNDGDIQKRSLYYWSRLYSQQLKVGQIYQQLRPVICIFLLDHSVFLQDQRPIRKYNLQDAESNSVYDPDLELLELYFLEIPKFKPVQAIPKTTLEKWFLFFQTDQDNVIEELRMSDKMISLAISELEIAAMNPEDRRFYEARLAATRDWDSAIAHSKSQGVAQGEHRAKLSLFQKLVQKKFPSLAGKYQAKIFMMSDDQLEQQILMFIDYPDQEAFEFALTNLSTLPKTTEV